jgi:hypothetical protein
MTPQSVTSLGQFLRVLWVAVLISSLVAALRPRAPVHAIRGRDAGVVSGSEGVTPAPTLCVGTCHGGEAVAVNDVIAMVNIALGIISVSACEPGDANADGEITIDEILAAVNNALYGCGGTPTTSTPTRRPTGNRDTNSTVRPDRGRLSDGSTGRRRHDSSNASVRRPANRRDRE